MAAFYSIYYDFLFWKESGGPHFPWSTRYIPLAVCVSVYFDMSVMRAHERLDELISTILLLISIALNPLFYRFFQCVAMLRQQQPANFIHSSKSHSMNITTQMKIHNNKAWMQFSFCQLVNRSLYIILLSVLWLVQTKYWDFVLCFHSPKIATNCVYTFFSHCCCCFNAHFGNLDGETTIRNNKF